MATEIVDLPITSMVIFHSYVSLPEGIWFITFDFGSKMVLSKSGGMQPHIKMFFHMSFHDLPSWFSS